MKLSLELFSKLISSLFCSSFFVCACVPVNGGNQAGGDKGSSRGPRYFKSESGQGSELFPLIGLREFDNQITVYSFCHPCLNQQGKSISVFSSKNIKPVASGKLYGPATSGPQCSMNTSIVLRGDTLSVRGSYNLNSTIDVNFLEVTRSEFIEGLKGSELGLKAKYRAAAAVPSFDQDNFDRACEDMLGAPCASYF